MLKIPASLRQPFQAPRELQKVVNDIGTTKTVPADTVLFKQGAPVAGVYLIKSGKIALSLSKGRAKTAFWLAEAGSLLGLPATVRNAPYSLTAIAVEDSKLVFASRAKMQRLLLSDPDLCFQAVQILATEIRSLRLKQ